MQTIQQTENNQPISKRGGKRAGAGRKKGSATRKTREIADRAAEAGLTPLEVMLEAMGKYRDAKEWDKAASIAKDAAPYMHPRLASIEHTGKDGGAMEHVHRVELVAMDGDSKD